jgi:para-nitrobenzyl esterase
VSITGDALQIVVEGGAVRGVTSEGARVYRGIPYAADPVGNLRFSGPRPHPGWEGVRDASHSGPAVPQGVSRLERVMGGAPETQGEVGCLTVNVFAPPGAGPHPVLFWMHGGGFSSGSGGWPWYDAASFAARHDVVVVTMNYRLGPLGFLYLPWLAPEMGEGNFGMLDQAAALHWVVGNIAAFGGDPGAITVGGQSAGALSAGALVSNATTRPFIRGAILQSAPASTMIQSREDASARARRFIELLGLSPAEARTDLLRVPDHVLVATNSLLARETSRFGEIAPAIGPVAAPALGLVSELGGALAQSLLPGVPLLIGTTRDEAAAFLVGAGEASEPGQMQSWADANPDFIEQSSVGRAHRGNDSLRRLIAGVTGKEFRSEVTHLASLRASQGLPTWVYEFDWKPRQSEFGSCHCIDLPFLFGTAEAFADAPMMGGESPQPAVKQAFQTALAGFVRSHRPDPAVHWPDSASGMMRHFRGDDCLTIAPIPAAVHTKEIS